MIPKEKEMKSSTTNPAVSCLPMGKMSFPKDNLFTDIHKRLRLLPGLQGLNSVSQFDQSTQTGSSSPLEQVRRDAETIATDIVHNFGKEDESKPINRYCKTMRRTVKELSDRHDVSFKGMVDKLNVTQENAFPTFVSVADEIFMDGKINWGRIVAVFTFAARLSKFCRENQMEEYADKIALFAGKYVGNKLGHWINDNGGWEAFANYFSEQGISEDTFWKGLVYTAAVSFGALATVVATR